MNPWQHRAVCRTAPDDLVWYPANYASPEGLLAVSEAKAACGNCPVRTECLEAALAAEGRARSENRYGVRGGMTPYERAAEFRRRDRAARLEVAA